MKNLTAMLTVAVVSIVGTLAFEHLSFLPSLRAQQASNVGEFVLFAGVRRDTEKNQSFIFHNPKTGDIWVYEDAKVTDHYRIGKVGENLEKLNK